METHPKLERLLKARMAVEEMDIPEPDLSLIAASRQLVAARKKPAIKQATLRDALMDFFMLRVRLYQAAISSLLLGGFIFYFVEISNIRPDENPLTQTSPSNNSVKSSTVLTSILTLVARD